MKTFPITLVLLSGLVITSDIHGAPGDIDLSFDAGSSLNRPAYAIAVQPDGKILIGGDFTTVAGGLRRGIARLNPDGTGDSSFNPGMGANGHVTSIALQPDGKVIIVGGFSEIDGVSRKGIGRLNADGSLDRSFDPGFGADDYVRSVALQPDGKVVIVGYFTRVNNTPWNYIARLNADGSVDTGFNPGSGADQYVHCVRVLPDGKILVAGSFRFFDGLQRTRIARLNPDGTVDTKFDSGTGGPYDTTSINNIAVQPDGRLLIVGAFVLMGHGGIARLLPDGQVDTTFNGGSGTYEIVSSVALQKDDRILVGGQFYSINGAIHSYLARLNTDGSLDGSFNPPLQLYPPGISCVALEPNGTILVSAGFFSVNGLGPKNLVRLNADGSINSLNPSTGINGYGVFSVSLQSDGKILIGGNFGDISNRRRQGIARLDSVGRLDESFDPGPILNTAYYSISNPVVYSVALQPDGKVIIGGGFTNINGTSRNNIARLNADGSVDTSFDPGSGTDYYVYRVILQPDGKVLIAGGLGNVNGVPRNVLARLNTDGSLDYGFNSDINEYPSIGLQHDGKIVIGGYFKTVNGIPRRYIARLEANGSLDTGFNSVDLDDYITSVTPLANGKIIIGGRFTQIAGVSRNRIARLNTDGTLDLGFDPGTGPDGQVFFGVQAAFTEQPDGKLLVWGFFTNFDGMSRSGVVRLNSEGSVDTSFEAVTGLADSVACVTLQRDSRILVGGWFASVNGVARALIARLLGNALIITTQPASRTNVVGTMATFTVIALGSPTLRYQWYRDGVPLSDSGRISGVTTATLTLNHVQFRDAGSYTVTVSNQDGSVSSDAALLSVIVPRGVRNK